MFSNKLKYYNNIHSGEDIYIIASGKSLDFLDKSFFDNKITIGINQSYKYLEPNYLVRKEHEFIDLVLQNTSDKVTHFISLGNCGGDNISKLNTYYHNERVVFFPHNYNKHTLTHLPPDDHLVVSYSTITTGIHLAAYMVAKNIILVGHAGGSINGESNMSGYHTQKTMSQSSNKEYKEWLREISKDTCVLKSLLKNKYNCNTLSLNPFINFNLEGNTFEP